jgi:hypothetical protein
MIFEALELLRAELSVYLKELCNDGTVNVRLGNVSSGMEEELLLSLVNVEEETTLRNTSAYQRNPAGGFDIVNPPVFLNLFVLVAAYSSKTGSSYDTALRRLSWVVQCFQRKPTFTAANTPAADTFSTDISSLRISLDLYSLSFEKASQLWSTLGDQQVPCVLYKVRLVEERAEGQVSYGPPILSIRQLPHVDSPSSN